LHPGPSWVKSAQVHVETSRYGPKSSLVVSGQRWAESTLGQVKLSGRYWVDPSRPRPISSRVGLDQCLVELSLSGPRSSQAGLGRYPDDRARAVLSQAGMGRCWAKRAWVDVELSRPKLMSSRAVWQSGQHDVKSSGLMSWAALDEVELPGPGSMSIHLG